MDENWTKRMHYQQAQTVFFVALSSRVKCYYWNKHFDFFIYQIYLQDRHILICST